ncbi:MAG TPA: extracellular solute-binding protein [Acidimicrobiales bacterium]|nr:extracellular solute-binding protein [Acidimicrobiales bacterium]
MSRHLRSPLLLLAVALALLAAACGVGDESSSPDTTAGRKGEDSGPQLPDCPIDALDDATGVVEVELWHGLGSESENNLNQLAEAYNASQDKVRVLVRNQGVSYDEVLRKYVAAIPSRQLPGIVYLEDTSLRQVVDSGTLLPAEACEQADGFSTGQLPAVRNYYTSEGVYWPGYTNVSEPVLYYNVNHFKRAGLDPDKPPKTLDELREAAVALKAAGIQAPLALVLNAWFVESWINGAGASVVNKDNGRDGLADESTFDNDVTRELYTWIKEMADEGLLEGHSATDGQINQYLAVAQQNSSMLIETSTAATTIKAVLGGNSDAVDVGSADLSAIVPADAPFPGLERPAQVRVSGGAFFITNTIPPEQQAAAWDFMKFMWRTENQVAWHLVGSYLPTTQTAANAPEVTAYWKDDLAGRLLKVGYDQLLQVDPQRPGPQIGPYVDYSDAIKNSLDRLVLQGASVDDAVKTADGEIQAALTRYVEDNG